MASRERKTTNFRERKITSKEDAELNAEIRDWNFDKMREMRLVHHSHVVSGLLWDTQTGRHAVSSCVMN